VLSGDATIRGIQSDLRGLLTAIPEGLEGSPVRMLGDVGISTDPSTGKLDFDQAEFKSQLDANPVAVSALFAERDGVDGFAGRALDRLEGFLSSNGALSNRTKGLSETLGDIQDQRDQLDRRIASYEERLIQQFSAADSLISQIQSTGNYVSQQLAAIAPKSNQS